MDCPCHRANRGSGKCGDIPKTASEVAARSHRAVEGQGAHLVNCWSSTSWVVAKALYVPRNMETEPRSLSRKAGTRCSTCCSSRCARWVHTTQVSLLFTAEAFYPEVGWGRPAVSTAAIRRVGGWSPEQTPKVSVTYRKRWDRRAHSRQKEQGAWVVQSIKGPAVGFGSGHVMSVMRWSPSSGSALRAELAWGFCLPLCLSTVPLCLSLSLR